MSNRLFSANCPVVHCAPKRVRRTWGGTVLTVLTLLALAALAGWLLHVLRSAAQGTALVAQQQGYLLAMAATGGGMSPAVATWVAWGVLTLCLAGLGALAWRRIMEWHAVGEFVDELQRASAAEEKAEMLKPETLKTDHGLAPAATTRARMPREDVRRIVEACQQECRDARTLVESARQTLSVDDYEDALVGASRRLKQVVSCLGNLVDELSEKAERLKTETLKDAFRVGPLESLSEAQVVEVMKAERRGFGWGTAWDVDEFWEKVGRDMHAPQRIDHGLAAAATGPAEAGTTNEGGQAR